MADTVDEPAPRTSAPGGADRARACWPPAVVALPAGALYAWGARQGAEHYYYSAAVRSMSQSWHAFAFGALDPAGSITVDKLPGMLWAEALCARLLGFAPWTLLLPHVLAATSAVVLLFATVRRWAGTRAGLLAAVALALTPITWATARATIPDTLLTLCLVAAAYLLTRSLTSPRWGWLLGCGLLVGVGFQVKMLAALLPLPAFVAAYLAHARRPRRARLIGASVLLATAAAACLPWMVLVTVTPPAERPWLDGTTGNSAWELVFVHNGLSRGAGDGPTAVPFGGEPGLTRLFNPQLGGQIGWLLPLALLALLAATATGAARRSAGWTLWGGWLLIGGAALSIGNGIHPYYATLLAPAIAALVGAGTDLLVTRWQARKPTAALLPLGIVLTGGWAWILVRRTPEPQSWVGFGLADATLLSVGLLIAARRTGNTPRARLCTAGLAAALVAGLAGPTSWILRTPALNAHSLQATNPVAGPYDPEVVFGHLPPRQVLTRLLGQPLTGPISTELPGLDVDHPLLGFLLAQRPAGRRYLFATGDASSAAPYLIAGHSVLPMGGFSANSPAPDTDTLAHLVSTGELGFIHLTPVAGPPGAATQRTAWVTAHCAPASWHGPAGTGRPILYDCRPATRH